MAWTPPDTDEIVEPPKPTWTPPPTDAVVSNAASVTSWQAPASDEALPQTPAPQIAQIAPTAPPSPAIDTSIPATAAGEIARNIAPFGAAVAADKTVSPITRAAGARAGATLAGLAGEAIGLGPEDPAANVLGAIGGVVGGLVGFIAPQFAAGALAKSGITKLADKFIPNSILGSKVEQAQEAAHPIVSTVVPLLMLGKPNPMNLVRAGRTIATTEGRRALVSLAQSATDKDALANWTKTTTPEMQKAVGNVMNIAQAGGINAAFNVASQISSGHISVPQLLESAAEGTLFNSPWIHSRNPATDKFEDQSGIKQETPNEEENAETPVEEKPQAGSLPTQPIIASVPETEGQTKIGTPQPQGEDKGIKFDDNLGDSSLQTIGQIAAMSPKEFLDYVAPDPQRPDELSALTRKAYELGQSADTQQAVDALKGASTKFKDFRSQFFREAYEAATGTGSAGLALSKNPDYHPPFQTPALPKSTEVSTSQPAGEVTPAPPVASEKMSVVTPAIQYKGKVYRGEQGETHDTIISRVRSQLNIPKLKKFLPARGFVLSDGSFTSDREKAADIAKDAGQVPQDVQELHSEDFWKAKGVQPKVIQTEALPNVRVTTTPYFKNWFGDWENAPEDASKMVERNGEPKVFYHGAKTVFDKFQNGIGKKNDAGWLGEGFYFYGVKDQAQQYGPHLMQVYLDIKNPYYADKADMDRLSELNNSEASKRFADNLKNEGYDGVYYNGDLREEAVVFNPDQIRNVESIAERAEAQKAPAPKKPTPTPVKKEWKLIGVNSEGNQVFEDANGVRSYVDKNIRISEPVQIIPTREGIQTATTGEHRPEFQPATVSETPSSKPDTLNTAIDKIAGIIGERAITKNELEDILAEHYGGTIAQGKFTSKDMTDALELAVNRYLLKESPKAMMAADVSIAVQIVERLKELLAKLPTQTTRNEEMEKKQQFSTPPTLAYAANWVAALTDKDVVLEPSAGVGGLAVFSKIAGAKVLANELSDRRAELLSHLGIADVITRHNAEHLNAFLSPKIKAGEMERPTAVVMNPPFSNAANANRSDTSIGAQHVDEALKLLPANGRLVAIVGEGMADDRPAFKKWWAQIKAQYNVRANIGVSGKEYTKYGTSFGNQLLVIDKTGKTPEGVTVTGKVDTVEKLFPLLAKIRDSRPAIQPEQPSAEPSGGEAVVPREGEPTPTPDEPAVSDIRGTAGRPRPAIGGGENAGGVGTTGRGQAGSGAKRPGGKRGAGRSGEPAPDEAGGSGGDNLEAGRATGDDLKREAATEGLTVEKFEAGQRKLSDEGVFSEYRPQKVKIAGSQPHPTPLVEPTAMASVPPVDAKYSPKLPKEIVTSGGLSDAQLENVVYAGQSHQKEMANGERMGYFIGDGTGVGKGRQIAAIVIDNWNQGRKRAVWVSKSKGLIRDAIRDLSDLGFNPANVIDFQKNGGREIIGKKQGLAFVPYSSLRSNNPGLDREGRLNPPKEKNGLPNPSRLHLLFDWLGKDYDGVIVFDEAHQAGNAIDVKGTRGVKHASEQGLTVLDVQKLFPKARVVYASATGATDVTNLSYADRLGIWGKNTPFPTKLNFFEAIRSGGLSAMEIVARDLKSLGRYLARTLSFEGVDHRQLVHKLTKDQVGIYDEVANAWQYVLERRDETMARTMAAHDGKARSAANSAFWGAQQRFYNQLLTALQMPSVISDIKEQRGKGNSVVLQLVNTDEASQTRQIAERAGEAVEGDNYLEDLDLSPKQILLQYLSNSYPTTLYEPYTDDNDNTRFRPVRDAEGKPVDDPKALEEREELLTRVATVRAPSSPLGMILDTFGHDKVAEITGRSQRVVQKEQPEGGLKAVLEKNRGDAQRKIEAQDFNDGKRHILVFSDAGGTGFSYHASRRVKNQERRIHYLIQAGWRADNAMQGFGRTHRSDQASAPEYVLVSTDIKGHQRFISSIARRLSELGALTGGERKSAGGEMFSEESNLENKYAEDGVENLFRDSFHGEKIAGMNFDELCQALGYTKKEIDEASGEIKVRNMLKNPDDGSLIDDKIPSIQQFLNRILSLPVGKQNAVFDAFTDRMKTRIENAKSDGSYDPGTQTLRAAAIRKTSDDVVYRDPESSAATRLVTIEHDHPQKILSWNDLTKRSIDIKQFVQNARSGRVFALQDGPSKTLEDGRVVPTYRRVWVNGHDIIPSEEIDYHKENYADVNTDKAEALWGQQAEALPKLRTETDTYVVGTFLPIWDRLKIPDPKIWRVTPDNSDTFLGARVPPKQVDTLRKRLGAGLGEKRSAEAVFRGVLENGETVELANGWRLNRRRVGGDYRIEVTGLNYDDTRDFQNLGGYTERIQWTPRYFLPTDEVKGISSMESLLEKSPEVQGGTEEQAQLPQPRAEITWQQAGYPSEQAFHSDYQRNGVHDLRESTDEFLRRRFCSGTLLKFKNPFSE